MVPGTRWRNCEILLLSEVAFTVSMVVMRRSFAALHSTRCMSVAARAALMLSLMAMGEVVRGEPSLLIMSLRSRRVRPFLVEGALGVVWGVAAAGAGFADGGEAFFLPFLATWAHVDGAGVDATGGGGGGGEGFAAGGSGEDSEALCWRWGRGKKWFKSLEVCFRPVHSSSQFRVLFVKCLGVLLSDVNVCMRLRK